MPERPLLDQRRYEGVRRVYSGLDHGHGPERWSKIMHQMPCRPVLGKIDCVLCYVSSGLDHQHGT